MIKSITIINSKNEKNVISLTKSSESGFLVTDISGLGPVQASINTTNYATRDGAVFNSARVDLRNIVISLRLVENGQDTIESLRQRSYSIFPIKDKITFGVVTENRSCMIDGYVESNEPIIFGEVASTQVSIICPDPYFYDYTSGQQISFSETKSLFHFPFYNAGTDEPTIKMGEISRRSTKTYTYEGDGLCGCRITICVNEPLQGKITITNKTTNQKMILDTDLMSDEHRSQSGVTFNVSSIPGNKYVNYYPPKTYVATDFLCGVASGSDWVDVVSGENVIEIDYEGNSEVVDAWVYAPVRYEGV